jgi:hypothetical protein
LNGKNNKKAGLGALCMDFYVFNKMLAPNEVKYSNWNNESEKLSYSGRCINQGIATFIADYLAERFNKIKNWTGKRIRFGGLPEGPEPTAGMPCI